MVNLKGEITITNEYMPNNRASKHKEKKLTELKEEIAKTKSTPGDYNVPLSQIKRTI